MTQDIAPSDVVAFWKEAGPEKWFAYDPAFDAEFGRRFATAHFAAARRELDHWLETADGALALMILLDQYPRNCFRQTGHAYATDPLALTFARQAVDRGFEQAVDSLLRRFFYLPFQHSEVMADQDRALALFQALDRPDDDRFAEHHHGIISRFGRFPHRNAPLGRVSTAEEQAFLDDGGFTGQPQTAVR